MANPSPPRARTPLSFRRLIPFAFSLALLAAHSAKAEARYYPVQDPAPQADAVPRADPKPPAPPATSPDSAGPGQPGPGGPKEGWNVTVGVAVIYNPAFTGSKTYQAMAFPDFKVEYGEVFFASLFGVGYNVIKGDRWRIGPIAKFGFPRNEDDKNPFRIAGDKTNALRGLGDVDATPELGGFVEYSFRPFSATVEVRKGIGGHEGLVGEASLDYANVINALGRPMFVSVGPRVTVANAPYNRAFFGINQTQAANSGLARYSAGGGVFSYGIGGFAMMPLGGSVSLGFFGGYDRLGRVAADSPLIKERGDRNQFMGGVRMAYEFGL